MINLTNEMAKDPLFFGERILRRRRWKGQRDMVRAMRKHRRVRFQSGNSTGKTNELAAHVIEFIVGASNRKAVMAGPSHSQIRLGAWDELRRQWDASNRAGIRLSSGVPGAEEWDAGNGSKAFIASPDKVANVQGGRGSNGTLIVVDEAQGVEDARLWDAFESLMQHEDSRLLTACNPLYPEGVDFEHSLSDQWHTVTLDCLSHPNVVTGRDVIPGAVSKIWVDECRRMWGEDDARWIARVLGRYPTAGACSLFSLGVIDKALVTTPTLKHGSHIGVDIAGEDGDLNVAYLTIDNRASRYREWTGINLMGTVGVIIQIAREWNVPWTNIHIDKTGIGEGVYARLQEQGYGVDGVIFGESPANDWGQLLAYQRPLNRRVEMYLVAAQLFRDGQLHLGQEFDVARKDLCATNLIAPHSSGASRLEEKRAIKKRLGRSPDHGDAFVLSLCRTGAAVMPFGFA